MESGVSRHIVIHTDSDIVGVSAAVIWMTALTDASNQILSSRYTNIANTAARKLLQS